MSLWRRLYARILPAKQVERSDLCPASSALQRRARHCSDGEPFGPQPGSSRRRQEGKEFGSFLKTVVKIVAVLNNGFISAAKRPAKLQLRFRHAFSHAANGRE